LFICFDQRRPRLSESLGRELSFRVDAKFAAKGDSAEGVAERIVESIRWFRRDTKTNTPEAYAPQLYLLNSASIFLRTVSSILIRGGHGLLNPSPASFRVASIPSFVPIAISEVAWSKTSAGPFVKIESRWGSVFAHRRNSTSLVL
jgi:hypothetical protein